MQAQVGGTGEVLPQETVGVLAGPALPRTVGIAEVDHHVRIGGEADVFSHFLTLVPGQCSTQLRGKLGYLARQGSTDVLRGSTVREVKKDHVAARSLHENADR